MFRHDARRDKAPFELWKNKRKGFHMHTDGTYLCERSCSDRAPCGMMMPIKQLNMVEPRFPIYYLLACAPALVLIFPLAELLIFGALQDLLTCILSFVNELAPALQPSPAVVACTRGSSVWMDGFFIVVVVVLL